MGQNREAERAEAYATALLLTLSGGFQDAYTYCLRGRVFANAQTGNVVLFSAHLLRGHFGDVLRYLIPIAAFVLGTCLAEGIRLLLRRAERLHWRQTVLLTEILVLFTVGFIAEDDLANALVSFSCAMQVQSFRKYSSYFCPRYNHFHILTAPKIRQLANIFCRRLPLWRYLVYSPQMPV